uniref:Uncharacterized protein n=1 Tax=Rhizophora mucronata TaxID=61149 RepID=A0A2P2NS87_RHIMU
MFMRFALFSSYRQVKMEEVSCMTPFPLLEAIILCTRCSLPVKRSLWLLFLKLVVLKAFFLLNVGSRISFAATVTSNFCLESGK